MSANLNGVMLQGFHWFLKRDAFPGAGGGSLWRFLGDEAERLKRAGVDAVWIPPAYKAAFDRGASVGYDVAAPRTTLGRPSAWTRSSGAPSAGATASRRV